MAAVPGERRLRCQFLQDVGRSLGLRVVNRERSRAFSVYKVHSLFSRSGHGRKVRAGAGGHLLQAAIGKAVFPDVGQAIDGAAAQQSFAGIVPDQASGASREFPNFMRVVSGDVHAE